MIGNPGTSGIPASVKLTTLGNVRSNALRAKPVCLQQRVTRPSSGHPAARAHEISTDYPLVAALPPKRHLNNCPAIFALTSLPRFGGSLGAFLDRITWFCISMPSFWSSLRITAPSLLPNEVHHQPAYVRPQYAAYVRTIGWMFRKEGRLRSEEDEVRQGAKEEAEERATFEGYGAQLGIDEDVNASEEIFKQIASLPIECLAGQSGSWRVTSAAMTRLGRNGSRLPVAARVYPTLHVRRRSLIRDTA
ncbi:hypothetical protein KC349_g162 [Hortaea werneckii]|nr:hypothetical protein KC349_g162 [Hortaea werneckii]